MSRIEKIFQKPLSFSEMISFRGTLLYMADGETQTGRIALKLLTNDEKELKTITLKEYTTVSVNFSVKDTVMFSYNTKRISLH